MTNFTSLGLKLDDSSRDIEIWLALKFKQQSLSYELLFLREDFGILLVKSALTGEEDLF